MHRGPTQEKILAFNKFMLYTPLMDTDTLGKVRAFNRFYTNVIGVIDRHILESPYSLTEARILYEIASDPDATARKIRSMLLVDEGYLSHTIKRLVTLGLVEKEKDPSDRRSARLALSQEGHRIMEELNQASDRAIGSLIEGLGEKERIEMTDAMNIIRRTLVQEGGAQSNSDLTVRNELRPGDLGMVAYLHGRVYAEEYDYEPSFEGYVAAGLAEFMERYNPDLDRVWICEKEGAVVGSLFIMHRHDGEAQLRYFILAPECRGRGLGKRLVSEALAFLRKRGYSRCYLLTAEELGTARALYERAGFTLTERIAPTIAGMKGVECRYELSL